MNLAVKNNDADNSNKSETKLSAVPPAAWFQLNGGVLKNHLKALFSVISASSVIPIMEDIKIEKKDGQLILTASDLANMIVYEIPDNPGKEFGICLDGKKIKSLLWNHFEDPVISFSIDPDKKFTRVNTSDFRLRLVNDDAEAFPKFPVLDKTKQITIDGKELLPVLERALIFASDDDLRPGMCGVYLCDYKDHLYVVATDAHKLYYYPLFKTPAVMKGCGMIVDKKTVRLILEMFKPGEPITIKFDENDNIVFSTINKRIHAKLVDARYPEFFKVLVSHDLHFYLHRKKMMSFLRMAEPFISSLGELFIRVKEKHVTFFGGKDSQRDFEEEFSYRLPIYSASKKFDDFIFSVSYKLLKQVFGTSNDEYVKIEHSTSRTSAIVIDDCILLMPLNTESEYADFDD